MLAILQFVLILLGGASVSALSPDVLPAYHYGAPIHVECMNRSADTGEHIENEKHEVQWVPFPICNETSLPLQFQYGVETELNCTIPSVSDPFFHLLEFYIDADAPLSCRIPSRPRAAHAEVVDEPPPAPEYIPLVFALAGTLQLSHIHVSTHMNVLLHSAPKHHRHAHDSGVLDSATAYSTSPLTHGTNSNGIGEGGGYGSQKLIIGDALALRFSVRWFPTPRLPRTEGRVEWRGMGGDVCSARTVFYSVVSFVAGGLAMGAYCLGVVLPRRVRGRAMGGATPLGYGVGNGWGYSKRD